MCHSQNPVIAYCFFFYFCFLSNGQFKVWLLPKVLRKITKLLWWFPRKSTPMSTVLHMIYNCCCPIKKIFKNCKKIFRTKFVGRKKTKSNLLSQAEHHSGKTALFLFWSTKYPMNVTISLSVSKFRYSIVNSLLNSCIGSCSILNNPRIGGV